MASVAGRLSESKLLVLAQVDQSKSGADAEDDAQWAGAQDGPPQADRAGKRGSLRNGAGGAGTSFSGRAGVTADMSS